MLKKIFNAIFGIAESTVKESINETKTLVKWYAFGIFSLFALLIISVVTFLLYIVFS